MVILDQSSFYPTSGGQANDIGTMTIEGFDVVFNVIDVLKVGKCVLHKIDQVLPEDGVIGKTVNGTVDSGRRGQL